MKRRTKNRAIVLIAAITIIVAASTQLKADTGMCGSGSVALPFTDVPSSNIFFCSIAEAYFSELTFGSSGTTYSPNDPVPREQMAAFVQRTLDQALKRGSKRAALKEFWTPTSGNDLGLTTVGLAPEAVASDGTDLWVASFSSGTVSRVRASDGKLLDTWTGADNPNNVLAAKEKIFVIGMTNPGVIYQINPTQPAGMVTLLSSNLGVNPQGIAFDGSRIWTANVAGGSVSIVTLNPAISVSTVTAGFTNLWGILFDGANIWVTDEGTNKLFKLDSNGAIIQTVTVGTAPKHPVFDGKNIWVPCGAGTVTVVRASTGAVLATLTGNGLNVPFTAAFDGERILVTNGNGNSVSLWKAADLSPLGSVSTGAGSFPVGACSDGLNFWITLHNTSQLARF